MSRSIASPQRLVSEFGRTETLWSHCYFCPVEVTRHDCTDSDVLHSSILMRSGHVTVFRSLLNFHLLYILAARVSLPWDWLRHVFFYYQALKMKLKCQGVDHDVLTRVSCSPINQKDRWLVVNSLLGSFVTSTHIWNGCCTDTGVLHKNRRPSLEI